MSNWTRAELKDRAKQVLKINYWIAFVVSLILIFTFGGGAGGGASSTGSSGHDYDYNYESQDLLQFDDGLELNNYGDVKEFYRDFDFPFKNLFIGVAITAALIASLFGIAISIFLFNPLAVGCYKFYATSAETPHNNMNPVGVAFKKGNYWGIVKGMFLKNLYTLLWTLLLIIPGIIKAYAYRMVPYILAANPQMDSNEAIQLSRKMMQGEKWKAFVLDLSFLGWYILGMLAFCIGWLFVNPYKFSADAQLYLVLRNKAITEGHCTPEMLNMTV